jgi:hypothetical protein
MFSDQFTTNAIITYITTFNDQNLLDAENAKIVISNDAYANGIMLEQQNRILRNKK